MMMSAAHSDTARLETDPGSPFIIPGCRPGRRRHWWALARAVLLVLVFLAPTECFADRWYKDYEKAVNLIGDGECSREAIRLLGAAVVDKPRPKLNARTIAVQTVDYLPYFQLARAHLACGELDSARHYLGVSQREGIAPADRLSALEQQLAELESPTQQDAELDSDPEALAGLVREVTENIRQARSLAEQVNRKRENERFAQLFRNNRSRLDQAGEDLRNAQEQLNDGTLRRDRSAIENASATALRALQTFSSLEAEIAELQRATPTAQPIVALPPPSATPTPPPLPSPTPVEVLPTPSPTSVPIRPILPGSEDRPREVPEVLRRAAGEFLRAEYENVVQELNPGAFADERAQAAAHLLRAASHFALHCLGGREDGDHLGGARSDLGLCRDLDPAMQPDPRFFSPEFVELFRGLR